MKLLNVSSGDEEEHVTWRWLGHAVTWNHRKLTAEYNSCIVAFNEQTKGKSSNSFA